MEMKHRTIYAFDDAMIATEQRLTRRWLPATVAPEPVIRPDRPWEGRCLCLYGTVLPRTGGAWRLYYNEWKPPFLGPDTSVVSTSLSQIMVAESDDGLRWTKPELVLRPDLDDEPGVEFYGMSVFERHGWFLGLLEYWRSDVDVIETHLAISRDGRQWQRPCRVPFIAATCDWNRAWSGCASNGPIMIGEQMAFLFGGRRTSHHFDSVQLAGAIGVASLPCDRFCCLEGQGGFFETPAFTWPGGDLVVNADTRRSFQSHPLHCNGCLTVEVLDEAGAPAPDWSGPAQARFQGNTLCRCRVFDGTVRWPQGRSLAEWQGRTIRLRFRLDQARLFTWGCAVKGEAK